MLLFSKKIADLDTSSYQIPSLFMKSFVWRGAASWNQLSLELRKSTKIGHFKKGVNEWVLRNITAFLD